MFPLSDPVAIFTILAGVILIGPLVAERLRLPDLVVLLLAGAILGPYGAGVLARTDAITIFGSVGLLYIMFLAGLDIDLHQFSKTYKRSIALGLCTFLVPQITGTLASHFILSYPWLNSILLGSMFASYTLLAYPIASRLGISRSEPVLVTVGATMVTDTLTLMVLAIVAESVRGAGTGWGFWAQALFGGALLLVLAWVGIPLAARWFFRNVSSESGTGQYVFVLVIMCAFSYISHLARMEPIIGAFISGAALSRMIPENSPLMSRVVFAGNTFFIPFFLISVGMLVNVRELAGSPKSWLVSAVLVGGALSTKFLSTYLACRAFGYSSIAQRVVFGLSIPQAAATLAAVIVGYNLKIFDADVLNGTIVLILVTCTAGMWMVDRFGRKLAEQELIKTAPARLEQRMLIPVANPQMATRLLDLAFLLRDNSAPGTIHPLTIVPDEGDTDQAVARGEKLLAGCLAHASAANFPVVPSVRVDMNPSDGIIRAVKELRSSVVLCGWTQEQSAVSRFFGTMADKLLDDCPVRLCFCRLSAPLNNTGRLLLVLPPLAERRHDLQIIIREAKLLTRQCGASLQVHVTGSAVTEIRHRIETTRPQVAVNFVEASSWGETRSHLFDDIRPNDMLLLCSERRGGAFWTPTLDQLPELIVSRFPQMNLLVVYPPLPTHEDNPELDFAVDDSQPFLFPCNISDAAELDAALRQMADSAMPGSPAVQNEILPLLLTSANSYPVELPGGAVLLHAHCASVVSPLLLVGCGSLGWRFPNLPEPARVILGLLTPQDYPPEGHLQTLAGLARRFHDAETVARVAQAKSAEEVCHILQESHPQELPAEDL